MEQPQLLTFRRGRFFLKVPPVPKKHANSVLHKPLGWELVQPNVYRTTNLKAAAVFRSFSDEVAERVFTRAFVKFYKDLKLPPLQFLDPHQIEGVTWMLTRSRSYLAHAPGAGKTAQAIIAALLSRGRGQTLFIVPPQLTINWEREIMKFTEPLGVWPSTGIVPLTNKKEDMAWRADFIICPDSMLTKPWVYERLLPMKKKFLAVDEASRFKDPFAKRSKAFYGGVTPEFIYHGLFQDATHTAFLDGSPMPNRPMELWAPTYALNPEAIDCMERTEFGFRYCGARIGFKGAWEFNHSSNEEELKTRLQKDFMHVVGEDRLKHPERRRSILIMNEDVRSPEHKEWEQRNINKIDLRELTEDMNRGDIATFRRELGMRKVQWIAGYVRERLAVKNESILLFAWHREVCEQLAFILHNYKPGLVIGGTKNETREAIFKEFQSGECRIIIGNIQAMGRGHNLQKADRVIFGEYSWTSELNKQCEKRASRRGNDKLFTRCEYIVCPNSLDEVVLRSVFTKEKRVEKVIG